MAPRFEKAKMKFSKALSLTAGLLALLGSAPKAMAHGAVYPLLPLHPAVVTHRSLALLLVHNKSSIFALNTGGFGSASLRSTNAFNKQIAL
jgi:hypothetical protein